MRTTITLADDVAAAIDAHRRERSLGLSEAVNELVRAGLAERSQPRKPFRQRTYDLGTAKVDLDNIADALETLDGPAAP